MKVMKFVSAVDNFMTTPSAKAPDHRQPRSCSQKQHNGVEQQNEVVEIAPITLMSPEQVKSLNTDQLALALTHVKM